MNSLIDVWLNQKVTRTYRKLIEEHKEACQTRINSMGVITIDTLPEINALKGQINAFNILLDVEQLDIFFENELENVDDVEKLNENL